MTTKLYKLTTQEGTTMDNTKWGEGVTYEKPNRPEYKLCTDQVYHAYTNANLAYLLNPIHAAINNAQCWEAEGDVVVEDWSKVGCIRLTTIKRIAAPDWIGSDRETAVCVAFAKLCAEAADAAEYAEYADAADAARAAGIQIDFEKLADKAAKEG